jgi:hypothetical protein
MTLTDIKVKIRRGLDFLLTLVLFNNARLLFAIRKVEGLNSYRDAGMEDYILPDFRKSEEAAAEFNGGIRLLFIDGSHRYEDVRNDILLWQTFLIAGGIIILHDYFPKDHRYYIDGVHRAVEQFIKNSPDFIGEGWVDSTFFASKKISQRHSFFKTFNRFNKARVFFKFLLDLSFLKTSA